MTIFSLCLNVTSYDLNTAVHPESNILTIETIELCVRLVQMWPLYASSGKYGKYNKHGLLYRMVWPLGYPTLMGGLMFIDWQFGASALI